MKIELELEDNIEADLAVKRYIQKTLSLLETLLGRFQQILKPLGSQVNSEGVVHLNLNISLDSKYDGFRWKSTMRGIQTNLEDFKREATQSSGQFGESIRSLCKGQKISSAETIHAIETCLNTYQHILTNIGECMKQVEHVLMRINEFLEDPGESVSQ
ncbi:hypothetical protein OAF34_04285 [Pirellulaceae bacterium]|nr:hypothetical protein [Pirellulaceae bacterium]